MAKGKRVSEEMGGLIYGGAADSETRPTCQEDLMGIADRAGVHFIR